MLLHVEGFLIWITAWELHYCWIGYQDLNKYQNINLSLFVFFFFFNYITCDSFGLQTPFFLWKFYCVTVSLFSNTVAGEEATLYFWSNFKASE